VYRNATVYRNFDRNLNVRQKCQKTVLKMATCIFCNYNPSPRQSSQLPKINI